VNNETVTHSTPPPKLTYMAYYYPWYLEGDWSQHTTNDIPILGYYGTDSVQVAEQHINWARRGQISTWVVSWWGEDSITKQHFDQGMLQASNMDQMKFCMLFESMILKETSFLNGTSQEKMLYELQRIKDEYFDHPSYFRINGRPVVVLYITRLKELYDEAFDKSVLIDLRNKLDEDIFFIADEPFFFNGGNDPATTRNGLLADNTTVFDAYTTYNMFENEMVQPGETASDYMLREALPIFEAWSQRTIFFPNILSMYHDFRGKEPLLGNGTDFLRQLQAVSCLSRPNSDMRNDNIPDLVFVTTFNEWWEGTQIEPDSQGRYAFEFLDTLATFHADVEANGYHWCSNHR
jgi:glycoprotein endo-alpha-1,2-mannosidase